MDAIQVILSNLKNLLKEKMWFIKIPMIAFLCVFLLSCGGGGGGGGSSDNATNPVDPGPVVSALVTNSENTLTTALTAIAGITSSQAQQITTAATNQLSIDSLLNSTDASKVLPSLLEGTMAGIGSLNLSDEELINTLIEQSVSTMMTLVGADTTSRQQRSVDRTAEELQSLLEVLVETALTNLEQTKLPDASLGKAVGKVVVAVVANLDKANVDTSDVSNTVDKVVGKSMAGLEQLPDVALESAVDEITQSAIEGTKTLKKTKTDIDLGESVGKVVSSVVKNLKKAKVASDDVSSAVDRVISKSMESLEGGELDAEEINASVQQITDGAVQGAGELAKDDETIKANLGAVVSIVAQSTTENLANLVSEEQLAAVKAAIQSTLDNSTKVVVVLVYVEAEREAKETELADKASEGVTAGQANLDARCESPFNDNRKIPGGKSVTAYEAESVAYNETCQSEERLCSAGVLEGSFEFKTCKVKQPETCEFAGQTVQHGQSVNAYFEASVAFGQQCQVNERLCTDGTLGGNVSYTFASCQVEAAKSCSLNGVEYAHGQKVTFFEAALVPNGGTCNSETVTCSNGDLGNTFTELACEEQEVSAGVFCGAPEDASCQAADVARFGQVKFGK